MDDCTPVCQPACPDASVFRRVRVSAIIRGGTRIDWELSPTFRDPYPYTYQLQVGRTGNPLADDWTVVGLPAVGAAYLIDDQQRVSGKTPWTHYRIQLSTINGVYYSAPQNVWGALTHRDWRLVRELFRQHTVRFRKTHAGNEGFLLKRRLYGLPCTLCQNDNQTGEVRQPQCVQCYGTGFDGGYFLDQGCIYTDMSLRMLRDKLDGTFRSTTNDISVRGMMLAEPYLNDNDVFVDRDTDIRYFVKNVEHVAEYRAVPVLLGVELWPANFNDVIYNYPIIGQTVN